MSEIPEVTEEQVTAFLAACAPLIGAEPPAAAPKTNGQGGPRFHRDDADDPVDIQDIVAALGVIPNHDPADWEQWNNVCMAVWRSTGGSDAGWNALEAWSAKHPDYDAKESARRWGNYTKSPPNRTGAGKLFAMAVRAVPGWKRPSEPRDDKAARDKANAAVAAVIKKFNARFLMVNEAGRAVIYQPQVDPVLKRRVFLPD